MAVGAGDRQIAITMPASALRLKWLAYFRPVVQMPADSAELGIVGAGQRLGIVVDANHSRHGSREFLARDPHLVGHAGEQRRLQIESRRIAFETLAAKDQLAVID